MKTKINVLTVLFFLSFANVYAQMSYYYQGKKIDLTVDRNFVHVITDEDFMKSSAASRLFQSLHLERDDSKPIQGLVKLKLKSAPEMQEYSKIVASLKQNERIKYVLPFFERGEGADPIGTSDVFYIKLKDVKDSTLLKKVADRLNVQIVKPILYMPEWYILSIQNSAFANAIDATNYFFETGQFGDIDPAFMFDFKPSCTNDPMFKRQWGLQNSSYPGIDVNICNAWTITRGAGVNVAVIDNGIDPNHNDLSANIHHLSFDAKSGTSPST